jgi:RNA polymerase sigma-70 factor (ECF subfamily)
MTIRSDEPELRALMLASLDADESAHRMLLTKLSQLLRSYFRTQFGRIRQAAADAEDLVQETLISIHTRRHTYDGSQLLTPWVYAIARYRLIDYLRRTKSSRADVPIEEAETLAAEETSAGTDSSIDLNGLLAQLSPKARQAIQFVKLDGLSVNEAAMRLEMSPSAIKVSVHRGLKTLAAVVRRRN